jgi:putative addiction module killer protein
MPAIFTTQTFDQWFEALKGTKGRFRIQARIDRAELGNLGDCEPEGG